MNTSVEPIPKEEAIKLCSEIRGEKGVKLFSQCWGCMRFSKGDPRENVFQQQTRQSWLRRSEQTVRRLIQKPDAKLKPLFMPDASIRFRCPMVQGVRFELTYS
jgi:hypothetical protein